MSSNEPSAEISKQLAPTTIWNKMFISVFFANMAFNFGLNMSSSMLSIFANSLGASAATIGLVSSSYAVSCIVFRLISAPVMDTYNKKLIVAISAATMAISFFGFAISKTIPSLIGFRLLQGSSLAFGNACCLTMVSETVPIEKYGTGIAYYSLAQVVAQAIGPSVGLWLVSLVGFKGTYFFTAAMMLVAAFLAFRIKTNFKRTKKLEIKFKNIIAKETFLPTSILFLMCLGSCAVSSFLILFAKNQGVTGNIGLYFTVNAVAMLITRPIIGKITDKYGVEKIAIPAITLNIIAFLVISWSTTIWGFLLAAAISAFGNGAIMPGLQALSMETVPNERRGAASSTTFIGMDIAFLLGPSIAGGVAQALGYVAMWQIMAIPFVAGLVLIFVFRKNIESIEKNFVKNQQKTVR